MTNNQRFYLPAEWEYRSAVLISWPHAGQDWSYMLDEVTDCYLRLASAIARVARLLIVTPYPKEVDPLLRDRIAPGRYRLVQMPTNDTWARDFGMICVSPGHAAQGSLQSKATSSMTSLCTQPCDDNKWTALDYTFNGWGLKFAACHDNMINKQLYYSGAINRGRCHYGKRLGFVLEGGSIDIDPDGVLLTTKECLLSPNRNGGMSALDIVHTLARDLGTKKQIWLEHGWLKGDDTDSHVDTLARFLPGGIIAYTACDREDDIHYDELRLMEAELQMQATDANGRPYRLVSLPIPEAIYDEDGERLPATYANFLIINGTVFMPIYNDEHYDRIAVEKIKAALPLYEVVTVDCRALIKQHGSLHCATMQIPDEIIL